MGLIELGVSSHVLRPCVSWVLETIADVRLPTYTWKRRAKDDLELPLFPSIPMIKTMSAEAEVLCDVRAVMIMMAGGRRVAGEGGDRVLDHHVGMLGDGATSRGKTLHGSTFNFKGHGLCSANLEATVQETSKAKAGKIGGTYVLPPLVHPCT